MALRKRLTAVAAAVVFTAAGAAAADTYETANFTLGINGGGANSQPPFSGVLPQGSTYTGSLVIDVSQIPAAGSGFQNVFFSGFPDIAQIPPATALNLPLGSLPPFTLASAQVQFPTQEAAIQYNNGVFNGLFYIADFTFQGSPYELQIQGGALDIVPIQNGFPTFNNLVSGYVDFGAGLTNVTPYTPPPPGVPEPQTWALMLLGVGLLGTRLRRRPAVSGDAA